MDVHTLLALCFCMLCVLCFFSPDGYKPDSGLLSYYMHGLNKKVRTASLAVVCEHLSVVDLFPMLPEPGSVPFGATQW